MMRGEGRPCSGEGRVPEEATSEGLYPTVRRRAQCLAGEQWPKLGLTLGRVGGQGTVFTDLKERGAKAGPWGPCVCPLVPS